MAHFSVKIPTNHEMSWGERIELFETFCALNNCTLVTHSYQPGYVELVCKVTGGFYGDEDLIDPDAYSDEESNPLWNEE